MANAEEAMRLIALGYRAALGEVGWGSVVEDLARAVGADLGYVWWADLRPGSEGFSLLSEGPRARQSAEALARHNLDHPVYTQDFISWISDGFVTTSSRFLDMRAYRRTAAHAEVCADVGMDDHLGITLVSRERWVASAISTYRAARRGPFTDEADHLAWAVAPHLSHAARIATHRGNVPGRAPSSAALEDAAFAAITVDRDGRVVDANGLGRLTLSRGRPVRSVDGVLSATGADATRTLHHAIAAALALSHDRLAAGPLRLALADGLEALVSPVSRGQAMVMILGVATDAQPDDPAAQLTAAESRVAQLLAVGATVPEVARALEVAPSTVKTHVKHIYAKLGIASRAELARLLR